MPIQQERQIGIEPGAPLGLQLHQILRQRIVLNEIPPGTRISDAEVAAEFGVSRQPVREAFIKLAEEGLLEMWPQRATFVRKIGVQSVTDARFLREAIEADIVTLLAEEPDQYLVEDLRNQIALQRVATTGDPRSFTQLDDTFHQTLASAAGKASAWKLIEGLKSQMDRVRFLSLGQLPATRLVDQHAGIVENIADGNVAGAEDCIRLHLREVLGDLPEILQAKPEFFDTPTGIESRLVKLSTEGGK